MKLSIVVLMLAVLGSACSVRQVPAGNVGVKVYLTGGHKGIDHETVTVGWQWLGMNEQLFLFPTFKQNYVWTKSAHEGKAVDESISFQTKEGLEVNADIGITYEVVADKVSVLFAKYRKGIDEITEIYLRNYVRDAINEAASKVGVEEAYGSGKTTLLAQVEEMVKARVEPEGIKVEKVYLIGQFRLPATVLAALNAKITATQVAQQRENEVAQAKAQANIEVAKAEGDAKSLLARARAEAEANNLKNKTLTDQLIRFEYAKRWNGELPIVSGGGSMPMFNLQDIMNQKKTKAAKVAANEEE